MLNQLSIGLHLPAVVSDVLCSPEVSPGAGIATVSKIVLETFLVWKCRIRKCYCRKLDYIQCWRRNCDYFPNIK